jgi:SET domain-containing protein
MDFDAQTIDIYCIRPIAAGEEILINYNGTPEDQTVVWFEKDVRER